MYLSYPVSGIILNNVLYDLYISVLWISVYIAPILSFIFCVPVNLMVNKYLPFRCVSVAADSK